ncbi:hypothetical protein CDD81_4172 [Ophiocordyceps australis]|uniref:RING-type domain-containing protein n=1 Tax=Ophiocordyceps australis TaxID=1399860 RepID=A0A2C5XUZ2_9HYPO|nr:hypothetical protein CDD81_4172 [Ophiocordyceps australis]
MRPPRIAILAVSIAAFIFLLCRPFVSANSSSNAAPSYPAEARPTSKSVFGFVYDNTPFWLFPPNAAISLTDDNSTSFAARPAAFGPKLAPKGLSGQLWVGSGFAEDSLDGNGELGCSDIPGWGSGNIRAALKNSFRIGMPRISASQVKGGLPKRGGRQYETLPLAPSSSSSNDNKTDGSALGHTAHGFVGRRDSSSSSSSHADIQSMQEGAEIQGKVVLLMRGGCGFLEKVMWAQRRGAVAVIVGDNQKGGPLIQMFAHGDEVENVTVPSVFTARTTAHLLSSLTQPGSFIEDSLDNNGKPVLKVQQGTRTRQEKRKRTPVVRRSVSTSRTLSAAKQAAKSRHQAAESPNTTPLAKRGWLARALGWGHSSRTVDTQSRPPSSGRLDWVLVDDWSDEKDKVMKESLGKPKDSKPAEDTFVIGVHDWRDPDFLNKPAIAKTSDKTINQRKPQELKSTQEAQGLKGGSITPSSGEYNPNRAITKDGKEAGSAGSKTESKGLGLMAKLFGDGVDADEPIEALDHDLAEVGASGHHESSQHEGLWVTITPGSSASSFFDTLLILVISPFLTLTVVYALLIVRSSVRRRRWRAPKSVVERLPVRTYHTVAGSPSLSPRLPSPSSVSPMTPLLQQSPTRPRPRSRTTTGIPQSENFLCPNPASPTPESSARTCGRREREKASGAPSAEWRKYMGRQVECVVCLEEYVDGVSRVMSLPCGHEFHADCITPWLTTRRRTCPICKGDVVRSMAHGFRDGPRYEPYRDGSDSDSDAEVVGPQNIGRMPDIEQGTPHSVLAQEQDPNHGLDTARIVAVKGCS